MIERMDSKYNSRINWTIDMLKRDSVSSNMSEDELIDRALWYEILYFHGQDTVKAVTAAKEHKTSLASEQSLLFFVLSAAVWIPLYLYWDIIPLMFSVASFYNAIRNADGNDKTRRFCEVCFCQLSVLFFLANFGSNHQGFLNWFLPFSFILYTLYVSKYVKVER